MSRLFYFVIVLNVLLSSSALSASTVSAMHPDLKTLFTCNAFGKESLPSTDPVLRSNGDQGTEWNTWNACKVAMPMAGHSKGFVGIEPQSTSKGDLQNDLSSGLSGAEPSGLISIGFGLLGLASLARQRRSGGR